MLVQTPAPSSKRARAKVQGTVLRRRSNMTCAQLYGNGPVLMRRRLSSRPSSTGRQIARTVHRRVQKALGVEQICRVLSNSAEKPGWFNLQRLHSATGVVPARRTQGKLLRSTSSNRRPDPTRRASTDPGAVQCVQVEGCRAEDSASVDHSVNGYQRVRSPIPGRPSPSVDYECHCDLPFTGPHTQVRVALARLMPTPPKRSRADPAVSRRRAPHAFIEAFFGCPKTVAAEFPLPSSRTSCRVLRAFTPINWKVHT